MSTLEEYLDRIEDELNDGKRSVLSNRVTVDVEEIQAIVMAIRADLPSEITRARKIIEDHDNIINDAKQKAEQIEKEAELRALELTNDHEIYRLAVEQAEELEATSKEESEKWMMNTCQYVDGLLEDAANSIVEATEEIEQQQQKLTENFKKIVDELYRHREDLR